MNKIERDQFEELFRGMLQNFEEDPAPEAWDAIAERIPNHKIVPLWRRPRYLAAAVAAVLCVVSGTLYYYMQDTMRSPIVLQATKEAEQLKDGFVQKELPIAASELPGSQIKNLSETNKSKRSVPNSSPQTKSRNLIASATTVTDTLSLKEKKVYRDMVIGSGTMKKSKPSSQNEERQAEDSTTVYIVDNYAIEDRDVNRNVAQTEKKRSEQSTKKWSFGLGSGSFTAGAGNTINTYAFRNSMQMDKTLMYMNAASINSDLPKTDVHHDPPITIGLAVSRHLNDRFALQTGLTFTMLSSDWKTNGIYHTQTKQRLYFVGLPLSVSYKIAEWNRFQFYTSAGGMSEINVSGRVKNKLFSDGIELRTESESIRMKELLWSVNAKVGISYPVFRFVSVFAEGGINYFFDNGSSIETYRSEKPFNAGFNAGIRFGF